MVSIALELTGLLMITGTILETLRRIFIKPKLTQLETNTSKIEELEEEQQKQNQYLYGSEYDGNGGAFNTINSKLDNLIECTGRLEKHQRRQALKVDEVIRVLNQSDSLDVEIEDLDDELWRGADD